MTARIKKQRIDKLVVELKLADTRQRAQALIMAGKILVNETPVTKAGTKIDPESIIRVKGEVNPFVSRGGIKLDGALTALNINVENKIILDVGASTGGFTDCCLKRGATTSYAVDVGTNQLAYSLRTDPRVKSFEKTNARDILPSMFDKPADIAVIDVSFISITKVLNAVSDCLCDTGEIIAMVKPQFEVGRDKVGKGGVVRNDSDRLGAVKTVVDFAEANGFKCTGTSESSIAGPKGNREIFIHLKKTGTS